MTKKNFKKPVHHNFCSKCGIYMGQSSSKLSFICSICQEHEENKKLKTKENKEER